MEDSEAQAEIRNLKIALRNARVIGAATGILMCRHNLTFDDAFETLRTASMNSHRKLHELADQVLYAGDLP